jgi:hypothetical protein
MFSFAYDGSVGGDWVSHYALRLASHHPDQVLHIIHVRDANALSQGLDEKLSHIRNSLVLFGRRTGPHYHDEPEPP